MSVNFPWKNYLGGRLVCQSFSKSYCQARFLAFSRVQSSVVSWGRSSGSVPEQRVVIKPKFLLTRFLFSCDKLKKHSTTRSYNSIKIFWNELFFIDVVLVNSIFSDSAVTLPLLARLTAFGVMWLAHSSVSFTIVGVFLCKIVEILENEEKIIFTTDSTILLRMTQAKQMRSQRPISIYYIEPQVSRLKERKLPEVWGNNGDHVIVGLSFEYDWLRKWREFFIP